MALFVLAAAPQSARAGQVSYSTTKSISFTPYTNTFTLPQFDPAYGTLNGVTWMVDATFRSEARIENLDSVSRVVIHGANETVTLWDSAPSVLISAAGSVRFTNSLARYDGISDYAGTSGVTLARRTVFSSVNSVVTASLAPYVGTGVVSVIGEVKASGFASGPVNCLQQVRPDAGFTLTVVYDYTEPPAGATIGDLVWNDLNGDGVQDPGEPGIAGVTVTLLDAFGAPVDGFPPTQTDWSGAYSFTGVPAGDYLLVVEPAPGAVETYDLDGADASVTAAVSVAAGDNRTDVDFGFQFPSGTLGDRVWRDDNGDGVQDASEPGIEGVTVTLLDATGATVVATATTDANGTYNFAGVPAGDYQVAVGGIPAGYAPTSDPDGVGTPGVATVSLPAGATLDTVDFGYQPQVSTVSGVVWRDGNRDGAKGSGETALVGVVVNLYDTTGTVVLASANTDANGAYTFGGLAAGHYVVVVSAPAGLWATFDTDGVGTPNQSETTVEALGTATVDFGYSGSTLGDRVWNDLNGDGVQDVGEAGIPGATVTLSNGDTTTTDANGFYSFSNLPVGTYTVTVGLPSGWVPVNDLDGVATPNAATVAVVAGGDRTDVDFGYQEWDAQIGDRVWRDDNGNGVQDAGEPGLSGVVVRLYNAAGTTLVATATTDASGFYQFGGLPAGNYTVVATQPAHHLPTFDVDGVAVPNRSAVALGWSESRNDVDFGYQPLSTLGSLVWLDLDANGIPDAGGSEPGLSGVIVTASGTGGTFSTLTDDNGQYAFTDLPPGTYTVAVTVPSGIVPTYDADGVGTPNVATIVIAPATDRLDVDFGYTIGSNLSDAHVGGRVWTDANGNGYVDGSESGRSGVAVALLDGSDVQVATTSTDAIGNYVFTGLPGGAYTVVVTAPSGYTQTYDADGPSTPNRSSVNLTPGEQRLDQDFGYKLTPPQLASIAGVVWDDADANGGANGGETGLAGIAVALSNAGGVVATTTTGGSGAYSFANVPAGSYTVAVVPPTYWGATFDVDGVGTPNVAAVTVTAGQNLGGVNFGYQYAPPAGSLGDRVWNDVNGNGAQDSGEPGLAGVTVTLRDSGGTVITSVVTDGGGYYGFLNVASGDYVVSVSAPQYWDATADLDGVGTANTTAVTVAIGQDRSDVDFGLRYNPPPALIGDRVWNDVNSNGVQDPGETGIANISVTLRDSANAVVATAVTDATGKYEFPGLSAGSYTVSLVAPQYYIPTYDLDGITTTNTVGVAVAIGETNRLVDFGLVYAPPLGSIRSYAWLDANTNGVREVSEAGLTNVVVSLRDASNGSVVATTTTDSNGNYAFTGLSARTYTVTVTPPSDVVPTFDLDGIATANVASVPVAIGENRTDVNFGYRVPIPVGSIGDLVWIDLNNNGVRDSGELGLTNVVVTLRDGANQVVATQNTDSTGKYLFTGLVADTYTVTVTPPPNHFSTYDLDGIVTPNTATLTLQPGEDRADVDFGYVYIAPDPMTGVIGDLVWSDANGNGLRDAVEPGLTNVVVELRNSAGSVIATTTTSSTGAYQFTGLAAGTYTVTATPPANYTATADRDGIATANSAVVVLVAGQVVSDADFGYMPPQLARIGDRVWVDANSNGVQDPAEVGMTNLVVTLYNAVGTQLATTTTGADGTYQFDNLTPGTYRVAVAPPANFGPTFDADGIGTPNQAAVTVTWGEVRLNVDFGYALVPGTGSIGNLVWVDKNANGARDSGETGLPNSTVRLFDNASGVLLATQVTDSNGAYRFTGLNAGTYLVAVTTPAGYTATYDLDGIATVDRTVVPLTTGQGRTDVNFGYMITPTGKGIGSSPGFWSKNGLSQVTPSDLAVLSALKLVEDNGADADFVNPVTGAFGGLYAQDFASALSLFGAYEGKATAVNMASQLSRQLAAFVLDMRKGQFAPTQVMDCTVVAGGKITAADLIALADSSLRTSTYTPSTSPYKAYQEALKNALQGGYMTYGAK